GIFVQDVVMPADEEAKVIVEAAGLRMMSRVEALVPLAYEPGGIAGGAEAISDGPLVERQAERVFVTDVRIELVAKTGLIAACEKSRAGRAAVRRGDVAAGAADAGRGQS